MSFSENLDIFFSSLDSKPVVFTLDNGTQKSIIGYFDNAFLNTQIGEIEMDTTLPRFTCKASDLTGIHRETPCVIDGANFSVLQIQPEGTGLAVVALAHE